MTRANRTENCSASEGFKFSYIEKCIFSVLYQLALYMSTIVFLNPQEGFLTESQWVIVYHDYM